jgi:acyl-CoA synthetase (NDP forming)
MEGIRNHADRLVVLCTVADSDSVRAYEKGGLLVFEDPVRAVRAVAAAMRLTASKRASSDVGDVAVEPASIGQGPVSEFEAKRLLADALIPVPSEHLVASRGAAVEAAQQCGSAVAMKIVSPDILHKTEIGGVILNVSGDAAVGEAFDTLMRRAHAAMPSARIDGVLVTPMAPRGVETIIGIKRDPTFGPLVMFGLGGVFVEVFKDVAFRLAPINLEHAHDMITEVKGRALLEGARGAGRSDIDAVASALVNASKFAAANADRIESVDINPFLVLPAGQGALALDAAIVPREPASG